MTWRTVCEFPHYPYQSFRYFVTDGTARIGPIFHIVTAESIASSRNQDHTPMPTDPAARALSILEQHARNLDQKEAIDFYEEFIEDLQSNIDAIKADMAADDDDDDE